MEAQGSFLPSRAGASSCGNKTWREGREVAVSRGIGLGLNPGLPVVRGLQNRWQGSVERGGRRGKTQPECPVHKLKWRLSIRGLWDSGGGGNRSPAGSQGPGHLPWTSGPTLTEELTELTIFPSLLGGIRGRVPAHLQEKPMSGTSCAVPCLDGRAL